MKTNHEQKAFTVFGTFHIAIVWSATAKGAAIRFMKKHMEQIETILPGAMVN